MHIRTGPRRPVACYMYVRITLPAIRVHTPPRLVTLAGGVHYRTRMTNTPKLNRADRAVYALLQESRGLDATHAGLYAEEIRRLVRAGLAVEDADGRVRAIGQTRGRPRVDEPLETLVARVPREWLVRLDAIGPTRSEATRAVLEAGFARGIFGPAK